jgi:hypothetical protein
VVIERHGGRALTFVWRNKGALTVMTVLETFLADPHAFPQCLLARCLQREHDRHACVPRCRRTDARNVGVNGSIARSRRRLSEAHLPIQDIGRKLCRGGETISGAATSPEAQIANAMIGSLRRQTGSALTDSRFS